MKKIVLSVICLASFFLSGFAQKTISDANAQVREARDFHAIRVSHAFDVYLTQGNEEKVAVSASDGKHLENIIVEVKNGVLNIRWENKGKKWSMGNKKLKAYVSFKKIDELSVSGACDVSIVGELTADDLKIELSGASDLEGKISARNMEVDMSGSSDMKVSGVASDLKLDLSGACSFKGFEFAASMCSVDASGASDVKITVNKELTVHASGASDVAYKGTGSVREVKSSGASSVKKAG